MNRSAKNRTVKMTIAAATILGSWAYSGANFLAQQRAAERSSILYAAAMKRNELHAFAMQQYLLARHPGKLVYRVTGAAIPGVDGDYLEKGTHAGVPYYVHGRYFLYLESPDAKDWDIGTDLSGRPAPRVFDCFTGNTSSLLPPSAPWYQCQGPGPAPVVVKINRAH